MVDSSTTALTGHSPAYVSVAETSFEAYLDTGLGILFAITAILAFRRMQTNRTANPSNSAETTVVTAFYSLIFGTAVLRAFYFLIPSKVWQPSYTPTAVFAFADPVWFRYTLSEITVAAGSLTLFSIFILILVYWADILTKYYSPGATRRVPMTTFLILVGILVALELLNLALFLCHQYTTEGMILFNAVLLAVTSLVCVVEITIFSRKFQNVLQTLGAINQVSTDSQVRRIVWITVTGNVFFVSRALLETLFAVALIVYYVQNGTVDRAFSHVTWDVYTVTKYVAELAILGLMLHILQSRFSNQGYTKVDDVDPAGTTSV